MTAKFISLEGGEGVGKSTNLVFIEMFLKQHDIPVLLTREPGGTVLAEKIRTLLLDKSEEEMAESTEILMMFAARAQHIQQVIEPALKQGVWVLCDRFTDATYAYQGGGRGLDIKVIQWLETFVQQRLRPDLTLLLDAPITVGMQRAAQRSGGTLDRFESEKQVFFENVRQAYLNISQQAPERVKVVNANQKLARVQVDITKLMTSFIHE